MVAKESQPIIGGSTSGVHFHGSAGLSIVGVAAICTALTVLSAVCAFYWASMQELKALRAQVVEYGDRLEIVDAKREAAAGKLAQLQAEVSKNE